jgi:hypothetical protein
VAAGRPRGSRARRVSLPGVAELLRPAAPGPCAHGGRQASGRAAHPQKITGRVSAAELPGPERARLALRGYRITVDRGRLVREAMAVLPADLDTQGEASLLAGRLRDAT